MSQRPFRDRVLHLLALRPYRKAELLLRLQKDGLAQADKDALDSLLQQVRAARCGAWGTSARKNNQISTQRRTLEKQQEHMPGASW